MAVDRAHIFKRHAVNPTRSEPAVGNPPLSEVPFGSWPCETFTYEYTEMPAIPDFEDGTIDKRSILPVQKIHFVGVESITILYQVDFDVDNCDADMEKNIDNYETRRNSKEPTDMIKNVVQEVDKPQNSVPTLPSKPEKYSWFKLPSLCDPSMPIDPQGRAYMYWLFLVTFCYCYNAWCITLRATFPYQTPENTVQWLMADYLSDAIYLLDVVFVKPRLIFLQEGVSVDDLIETRNNYKKKLQYKFDVISLLPLDILYLYYGTGAVLLRFPRLLKLQTFWEFHGAMDRLMSSPFMVPIGKSLFYMFYMIHLNACAFYSISERVGFNSDNWVYNNQGNAYIRCFYYATRMFIIIGKYQTPVNVEEKLYVLVAWAMGVFAFLFLFFQVYIVITTTQDRMKRFNRYQIVKVLLFSDCSTSLLRDLVPQLQIVPFLPEDAVVSFSLIPCV